MPRYRTAVAIAIKGDRVAKGSEIELSAEVAARFDPADLVLIDGVEEAIVEETPEVALADMSAAQLKARAKELGLSQGGSAADIRERIELHLAGNDETTDEEGSEAGEGEGETTDETTDEEGSEG